MAQLAAVRAKRGLAPPTGEVAAACPADGVDHRGGHEQVGHLGGTPAEPERQKRDVALAAKRPKCVERVGQFDFGAQQRAGCRSLTSIPIAADRCLQLVAADFAGVVRGNSSKMVISRGTALTYICDSVNGYV